MDEKFTNELINETSPYLLQHAHNPVNWFPWGEKALNKARSENKMIIISIGYAACHWCHVMENETFEDKEAAKIMNENFVCIKVDREERPDIDQIYMNAVQLLTGSGGWPLNCIALPDGRPVFGGTYFPKQRWITMLKQVLEINKNEPEKIKEQANYLTEGIRSVDIIDLKKENSNITTDHLDQVFSSWKNTIDYEEGGHRTPMKFPLPAGYQYLMYHNYLTGNEDSQKAVEVTLDKMASGGIYDQIGGGFSRYSVDRYWKVPHFEKMLYDNAQLVSLYSFAYQKTGKDRYREIVYETLEFLNRELTSPEGAFYSSFDADSEGEEGKFYVWSKPEIEEILGNDAEIFIDHYGIKENGNWEKGKNILVVKKQDSELEEKYGKSVEEISEIISESKKKMLENRSKRIRPGLDDKILTSWNSLMIKAYVDAYRVFGKEEYLNTAVKAAEFIIGYLKRDNGRLFRNYKAGKSSINGFLDDHAFTIQAFISLYQATFDEFWLSQAKEMTEYVLEHYYDEKSRMFFYTSDLDEALVARKMEIADNVIPSSNSEMAKNLFLLGHYYGIEDFINISRSMLNNVIEDSLNGGPYYANWDILAGWFTNDIFEIAITGKDAIEKRKEFDKYFIPDAVFSGTNSGSDLPLLKDKLKNDKTTIYVCRNKTCNRPATEVVQALEQIL